MTCPIAHAPRASAVKMVAARPSTAAMLAHSTRSFRSIFVVPRWNRVESRELKIAPRFPPISTIVGTITARRPYCSSSSSASSSVIPAHRTMTQRTTNSGNMLVTMVFVSQLPSEPPLGTTIR